MEKEQGWLIFSYKVPSEPSTLRVRTWRTLKALGVIYIQQSVCVAPETAEVRKKILSIKNQIEANQGETILLEATQLSSQTEEQLHDLFNQQRITEYEEFLGGCKNFLNEIDYESKKGNFSFHEVEENESELAKLKRWFRKIEKRDFFSCPTCDEAKKNLLECEKAFSGFTSKVYETEGHFEGNISFD